MGFEHYRVGDIYDGVCTHVMGVDHTGPQLSVGRKYPRSEDQIVMDGPYKLMRHPMYTAALSISLGLACLTQSWGFFCVFCIYLVLIFLLVPMEENGLQKAYGDKYIAYQRKSRKLIPFVY
jgi:protein-S-isoprenylcysteine O-methyltransferase Ste14